MMFKVRDRKTGNPRLVTPKAYAAMGPKVYEKLATVNDDGSEIVGQQSPNQNTPLAQRSVRAAGPVVVKSQLVAQPVQETENDNLLEGAIDTSPEPVQEKRKPGRQPGSKNKSISSNSTADEK